MSSNNMPRAGKSRAKKIILGVIAAFVALIVIVMAAVSIFINPNDYKDRIASMAEDALGRKVHIEGDLSLSVFPWIAIKTGAIRVENPPEFGGGDFVSLKEADLSLEILPLLTGNVNIGKVTVRDMVVLLVKDKNRSNWEFAPKASESAPAVSGRAESSEQAQADTSGTAQAAENPEPGKAPEAAESSSSGFAVTASSLVLENADITFRDRTTGASYQLKQFNFKGDNLRPDADFSLTAEGLLIAAKEAVNANFKLESSGSVNPAAKSGSLPVLNLEVDADGKGLPGGKATLAFKGGLDIGEGLSAITTTIESLTAQNSLASLEMAGKIDLPADRAKTQVMLSNFLVQDSAGSKISFTGDIAPMALSGKGDLKLSLAPRKSLSAFNIPLETRNPDALSSVELASPIVLTPAKGISLENISGGIDNSKLSGTLACNPISLITGGNGLTINGNIKFDSINVDDYLPPEGAKAKGGDKGAKDAEAAKNKDAGGKSSLAGMNGKVQFAVDSLTVAKMVISNLSGILTMTHGEFNLDPCTFTLFKGKVDVAAKANMAKETPPVALNLKVKGLALGDMLQALSGEAKVTGDTDLTLDVTGAGKDWPALSKTLGGSGALSVRNGLIHQVKILPDSVTQAGIVGLKPLKPLDGKLESLTATFKGQNGRFTNNDLKAIASMADATGAGSADLGRNAIDYALDVNTAGMTVPVTLTGSLNSPSVGVDTEKLLKGNAGQLLEGVKDAPGGVLDAVTGSGSKSGSGGSKSGSEDKNLIDKLF